MGLCYKIIVLKAYFVPSVNTFNIKHNYKITIKHIIVSPDANETDGMDYPEIKKKAYKLMKRCGVLGGVMIVHPFRCNDYHRYEKPGLHFHILGYGNVRGNKVKETFEKEKWIIKNKGKRKSVFVTANIF